MEEDANVRRGNKGGQSFCQMTEPPICDKSNTMIFGRRVSKPLAGQEQ
jgi:hypothetical protein